MAEIVSSTASDDELHLETPFHEARIGEILPGDGITSINDSEITDPEILEALGFSVLYQHDYE